MRLLYIYIFSFIVLLHILFHAGNFTILKNEAIIKNTFFGSFLNETNQGGAPTEKVKDLGSSQEFQLKYFKGEKIDSKVILSWEAEKECNSVSFLIEKSFNGIAFKELALVAGKSKNEKNVYNFIDTCSVTGQFFYRLKQKKSDGTYNNLDLLLVNNTKVDISGLLITGEPCIGKCNISKASLDEIAKGNKKILMLDFMGNVVPVDLPGLNKTRINVKYNPTDYFQSGVLIARSLTKTQTKIVK
ncbi:MAG: hypothetical protein A2275_08285 [Bacteroidetes bacterium RIFOXYA12_FULL_35_11]|nr:MAG: hypothetical protein A2X01_18570 [Bacteroidetes bacterium GWF2_35_48]OFY73096.1 MAG: hypothetical protein A2275_08285 [Bacteroidetes bacterium RIFOXYA12_FULL_35_11]HBX53316.1 hypothetical protein [Bacteroidales bacterium]